MHETFPKQALPPNFAQDFLPDRRLLSQIIKYAATEGSGDKISIGLATGVPTGKSSGKVEPMIYYCVGMGLVRAFRESGTWRLSLTTLGRVVLDEDPYLSESVTLWMIHLMLCRRLGRSAPPTGVADAWFALFAEGAFRLGLKFTQEEYVAYLITRYGKKTYLASLSGNVLRSYLESSCLGNAGILKTEKAATENLYTKGVAPKDSSHFPAYSAYAFSVWSNLFPSETQISVDEFFSESRFLSILNWDKKIATSWIDWMADHGIVQVDRQTGGALLLPLKDPESVTKLLYSELL